MLCTHANRLRMFTFRSGTGVFTLSNSVLLSVTFRKSPCTQLIVTSVTLKLALIFNRLLGGLGLGLGLRFG